MSEAAVVRREGGGRPLAGHAPALRLSGETRLVRASLDLRWLLTALALGVVLVIPFCLVDVPPVLDYPNHLARYFVLAHPADPLLSQFYAPHWRILPNLGMDVLAAGLLRVTDVHVGGRVLLALSLFAPVIGVIVYHRAAFGRWSYWSLASGLMAHNGIFFLGFMNFLLALGLALIAAAVWTLLRKRGFQFVAAGVGAVSVALVFFCHIFGVVLFALLIGTAEADRLWRMARAGALSAREVLRTGALIALTLAPAVALYLASPLSDGGAAVLGWGGLHKLWDAVTPFMTYDKTLTALTALAVFSVVVLTWREMAFAPGIALALLLLVAALIATPLTIKNGTFVDNRLAIMIGLLLFAGMQPRIAPRFAMATGLLVAVLIVGRVMHVGSVWIDHSQDLADLRAAIAPVEPGARVLAARGRIGLRDVEPANRALPGIERLDTHLAALLLIERKAFWPLLFADATQQPLVVKPPYDRIAHPLFDPVPWALLREEPPTAQTLSIARYMTDWRSRFDYVLLIDPPDDPGAIPRGLSPVYGGAFAKLYRVSSAPDL